MIYGYVRVSTKTQSIERQIRNIKSSYPEAVIFQEAYTGTTMNREAWNKLTQRLREGDTVIFDSVSRMSRNAEQGYKVYESLFSAGIDLIFLKEPQINTTTYKKARENALPLTNTAVDYILEGINKYLLEIAREQILISFQIAEKEVLDLRARTREGLITAKLNNKTLGHTKNTPLITRQSIEDKATILKHSKDFGGSLSDTDCMKLCKCCRKSFYKYKKELREGHRS